MILRSCNAVSHSLCPISSPWLIHFGIEGVPNSFIKRPFPFSPKSSFFQQYYVYLIQCLIWAWRLMERSNFWLILTITLVRAKESDVVWIWEAVLYERLRCSPLGFLQPIQIFSPCMNIRIGYDMIKKM